MKILVTGSSGFIGSTLVERLLDEGHVVRGLDIRPPTSSTSYAHFAGDIRVPGDVRRAAEGMDLIVSLAAEHKDFGVEESAYFSVNDTGTRTMVEVATSLGIRQIIFYSSVAVYGDPGGAVTEETPQLAVKPYGRSKKAGEQHLIAWTGADASRAGVIVRPCVVFGPRNFANMYNLINTIARRRFVMVGSGANVKSVAYVGNLVAATMFLIRRMQPGIETCNYSDGPQTTVDQLVGTISRSLGLKAPRLRLPLRPVVAAAQIVDLIGRWTGYDFPITANRIRKLNTPTVIVSDKIRRLGFVQATSVEQGLKTTVNWYLGQRLRGQRPVLAPRPELSAAERGGQ